MPPGAQNTAEYQPVRAPRGNSLSCKGWQQEGVLRMLLNCLDPEVAEHPQDLVISGATGKAASGWDSFRAIVPALRELAGDETLVMESGRPAGVSRSSALAPRLVVSNAPGSEVFGDWLYAGTQTALPVLYELYGAAARRHFGGILSGKLVIGAGMGGAGGAQALAATLHGAAFLGIDADSERINRRVKNGYCEVMVNHLDEALRMLKNAVRQRTAASVGLIGNCADVFPELVQRGVVPDLLTDCTPTAAPFGGYIPGGLRAEYAAEALQADAGVYLQRVRESVAAQLGGMRELQRLGSKVIAIGSDFADPQEYLRPLLEEGRQPAIWLALSGEPGDIARADRLALEILCGDERLTRWLALAAKYVRFQGLPARVAWLRERDLSRFGVALNGLVARGEVSAPIVIGCRTPFRESGPAAPTLSAQQILKALPSIASGPCWVSLHGGAGPGGPLRDAAQAFVADGTADAGGRLSRWLAGGAGPKTA